MTVIIDCGLGNVGSVINMVKKMGGDPKRSARPADVLSASRIILPGVGAFDHGMRQLQECGLVGPIRRRAEEGIPVLGICLGMHLLGDSSAEGKLEGLRLIPSTFERFSFEDESRLPIPHVGWNEVKVLKKNPLIPSQGDPQRFYFTHSYHAASVEEADVLAIADYGYDFPAVLRKGTLYGVQFHPEKSHRFGMALIENFLGL